MSASGPLPIADYAYIADCHSAALVSRAGSIDWCCMPRVDSKSCFARLLDWESGGYCQIVPSCRYESSRRYVDNTLILETTFGADDGEARLCDCFAMRKGGEHYPHRQIRRIVEGVHGTVPFIVEIVPRFDYGSIKPWIRHIDGRHHVAIDGSDGLFISGDLPTRMKHRHDLEGRFTIKEGDRLYLSLLWRWPEDLDEGRAKAPDLAEIDRRFEETLDWWRA
jgi:GH15 family glucan-1,4-alpha-glucosidase